MFTFEYSNAWGGAREMRRGGSNPGHGYGKCERALLAAGQFECGPQISAAQPALAKLRPNNRAEKMTIVGPTVGSLKTKALRRKPPTTETRLAAEETRRKFESLSVRWRAVAAGRIIRALASNVPIKRRPTRIVRLKISRNQRSTRSTFTPVEAAKSGEKM